MQGGAQQMQLGAPAAPTLPWCVGGPREPPSLTPVGEMGAGEPELQRCSHQLDERLAQVLEWKKRAVDGGLSLSLQCPPTLRKAELIGVAQGWGTVGGVAGEQRRSGPATHEPLGDPALPQTWKSPPSLRQ